MDPELVRADFDRIARALGDCDPPDEGAVPTLAAGDDVLDVGCGTGVFAARIAPHVRRVVAIDLSPEMLARARARGLPNVELHEGDFLTWRDARTFDAVVSVAALHHMPFEAGLSALAARVRPAGLLFIRDLFASRGLLYNALSFVLRPRRRTHPELAAAWRQHGVHERHLPFAEIRRRARAVLPAAAVHRHLGWRYTLVWRRPA